MNRGLRGAAVALLIGGGTALAVPTPAGAAVTVTSAGTVVTVNATGVAYVRFACNGSGKITAGGVAAAPAVDCSAVTRVNVVGDGGAQTVVGDDLNYPAFAANPYLVASLGLGVDQVSETDRADSIDTGGDNDAVFIKAGGLNNTSVSLGAGTADDAYFDGTDLADTITAASTTPNVSVTVANTNGSSSRIVLAVDRAILRGGKGNDTISATGVTAASSIGIVQQAGGPGNDTLRASATGDNLYGDDGTNTYYGGVGQEQIHSSSETDIIHLDGGGNDEIFDDVNGRSGGRVVDGSGAKNYFDYQTTCDAQIRFRPGTAPGGSKLVASLCRPGIADLPNTMSNLGAFFNDGVDNKALADVIIPGNETIQVVGDTFNNDLADITVPSGAWVQTGSVPGQVTIDPVTPGLGTVKVQNTAALSVHGPWTNKNQGFGHRAIRDLLFRFPSIAERDAIQTSLAGGTKTRGQVVASLMDTDEYRGLDVDRVFVRFLKRTADPGGRTYWINGLRNGKTLRKFRAQLFGSNEYFANSFSDNGTFVRNAYFDVLGRVPDPAGLTYWVNKINAGTGRGSVANSFLSSTEARRAIVKDQFLRFALRTPTTNEANAWIDTLATDTGEQQLIAFLAASGAYYDAG